MNNIILRFAEIIWIGGGVRAVFDDGSFIDDQPMNTGDYFVLTDRSGYGGDRLSFCRERMLCQEILSEHVFGRPSASLWQRAHKESVNEMHSAIEELATHAFLRWVRANEKPLVAGIPWEILKREALGHIRSVSRVDYDVHGPL